MCCICIACSHSPHICCFHAHGWQSPPSDSFFCAVQVKQRDNLHNGPMHVLRCVVTVCLFDEFQKCLMSPHLIGKRGSGLCHYDYAADMATNVAESCMPLVFMYSNGNDN